MNLPAILPGSPPVVVTGENTAEASRQAGLAAEQADLARAYAISDTDTPITGAEETSDRGAKYYADKAQTDGAAQVALAETVAAATIAKIAEAADVAYLPGAVGLLFDEEEGFAIDAGEPNTDLVAKVVDGNTPANNYFGSLAGLFGSSAFPTPKFCKQPDGSYKYNAHNDFTYSEDFANAAWGKTGITITSGQVGPDGDTEDASLLTATGATASIDQYLPLLITRRRMSFRVKAGTANWCYLEKVEGGVTKRASFDLENGVIGTVTDTTISAEISSTDASGAPLAEGWYYVSITWLTTNANSRLRLGIADGDNSTAVTAGKTILTARAQLVLGANRLPYLKTTSAVAREAAFDWTNGQQMVRLDPSYVYRNRYGDDLTNAAWTKTDCTAAFDAIGPHNEPCSTLTATADNAVAAQSITAVTNIYTFMALVRRKTGTGAFSMSLDAGANYTEVTAAVDAAGEKYALVALHETVTNPEIRFKIAESGDEFEIALVGVTQSANTPPPAKVTSNNLTTQADSLQLLATDFPTASQMTYFVDGYREKGIPRDGGKRTVVGLFNGSTSAASTSEINVESLEVRLVHRVDDGTAQTFALGNFEEGGRLQMSARVGANDYSISHNGSPSWWNSEPGEVTYDRFGVRTTESFWLSRLVIVPRDISDRFDDLRLWNLDTAAENIDPKILATAYVDKAGDAEGSDFTRIPGHKKLYERGDVVGFVTCHGQHRFRDPKIPDLGLRTIINAWEFDRSTNKFTRLWGPEVLVEMPGWEDGLRGTEGMTFVKLEYGPFAGRLLFFSCEEDSVSGTSDDDDRNLYIYWSDDNGRTWSDRQLILARTTLSPNNYGFMCTGSNGTGFQLTEGPQAGRVYIPLNANNEAFYAFWCDDFKYGGDGAATADRWFKSTTPVPKEAEGQAGQLSEPALSLLPDKKTLVISNRAKAAIDDKRTVSFSTDYGANFSAPIPIEGDNESTSVNAGFVQTDPDGGLGRNGRFILATSTREYRVKHKIRQSYDGVYYDPALTYQMFSPVRFVGYCPVIKAFEADDIYIMMYETAPKAASTAATNPSQALVAFRLPHQGALV